MPEPPVVIVVTLAWSLLVARVIAVAAVLPQPAPKVKSPAMSVADWSTSNRTAFAAPVLLVVGAVAAFPACPVSLKEQLESSPLVAA